jgi:hypothetical protein
MTPRQATSATYSRSQLDAAFDAMMAEGRRGTEQRQQGYSSGVHTDISA